MENARATTAIIADGYRCFVGGDDNDDATSSGGSNAHRAREFPMAGPPSMVAGCGSIAVTIAPVMVTNDGDVTFNDSNFSAPESTSRQIIARRFARTSRATGPRYLTFNLGDEDDNDVDRDGLPVSARRGKLIRKRTRLSR